MEVENEYGKRTSFLGYAGGCHLGPIGRCHFCGKELRESWGLSGYRLWYTDDGKRHPKGGCNVLDPIWFSWAVWERIGEMKKGEEEG